MKIVVLGAGAMGALFGGYLSRCNDVVLVDVYKALVDKINKDGVLINEPDGSVTVCHPKATANIKDMQPVDLIIVFVKAMYSHSALEANKALIGPDTCLMTLQNGSGHEDTLLDFTDHAHVIIGTTQHNSAVGELGSIKHGGSGITHIGRLEGGCDDWLEALAENFTACGLETDCSENVQKLIWEKLFTNVSASALTGALQQPLGYIVSNPHAWELCKTLIKEAVDVANKDGMGFDAKQKTAEVKAVCERSPKGITSICADLANGRKSEVDTISGSVVRASMRNGTPAPSHKFIVELIHALEERPKD